MNRFEQIRANKVDKFAKIDCFQTSKKGIDSGAFGKAFELLCTPQNSTKIKTSGHSQIDIFINIEINGKKTRKGAEVKTNGGRIDGLIKEVEAGKNGVIIYKLKLCNSLTYHQPRETPPLIFTYQNFYKILKKCNAIKKVNKRHKFNGYAIQCGLKSFYQELEKYDKVYNPETIYKWEELQQ